MTVVWQGVVELAGRLYGAEADDAVTGRTVALKSGSVLLAMSFGGPVKEVETALLRVLLTVTVEVHSDALFA